MNSKESTGVLDIPRPSNKRQRRIRRIIYSVVGLLAIVSITYILSRLKPAAPIVDKTTVWVDTVKKGPMLIEVRGRGVLVPPTKGTKAANKSAKAQLKIPEAQAKDVQIGQPASIDTRDGIVPGHVVRVDPSVAKGALTVDVKLDGPLPKGTRLDLSVDGTIEIEKLKDAIYVGRPVFCQPNSTVEIFKLDQDGKGANRVPLKLGRASVNSVEILSGLQPADKVIISDMSAWDGFDRIRLE
jgi:hypothetical protein